MRVEKASPWIILVLSLSFLFQAILSVWDDSPTYDETINPSVGYVELLTGDLSFLHDHPPLYRVFMALPLLGFQPIIPLEHDSWQEREKGMLDRYNFAREFFYVANNDADRMLFWSRIPMVFLSLLLGLLVFQWAKELYGNHAGLFAFFLYSFEPNIIAHSRFAINDLVLALFVFSTVYQFWLYSRAPSLKSLVLTGVLLGLALISKFSSVMLLPMMFGLALLRSDSGRLEARAITPAIFLKEAKVMMKRVGVALKTMIPISAIAVCVVLFFYGGQWENFTRGLYDTMVHYHKGHAAFLLGSHSIQGWWYYFPIAFLLKTPIPLLIYILTAFLFLSFRKKKAEYYLLIPVGIILLFAFRSHINIGIRHILPVYPFLIVLVSSITTIRFSSPQFFVSCFTGLALWYVVSTLTFFPSYLAYFNEFVGPKRGYLKLVDSNLDWGQDLKRLKKFMDQQGISQIYLSYFGTADPCYYKIDLVELPAPTIDRPKCRKRAVDIRPDFIAISATNLQSVYFRDKKSFEWLKGYEPIAQIGYSIFVYDIKGDVTAHNKLGILFLKFNMPQEALKEFELAVKLAPNEAPHHANLGYAYHRMSSYDKAKSSYEKALLLDPESILAQKGLKAIYSNVQK